MTARAPFVRVALLAVLTAAIAAQEQPRPTFKTEANYVRVDVFPTRDGVPITDLTAADFEIIEDKAPQKIDAFQHIVVRANVPQDARREPNNVRESRAMLEDPDARAFVLFLDLNHVEVDGSHNIRKPLVDALDKLIGENDLVGVMTPEMSAGNITFARKTTTIEGILSRYWTWGEREQLNSRDPMEDQYRACFPGRGPTVDCPDDDRGVYAQMIERRKEKQTMNALDDLVGFIGSVREERKAIIAISDGWLLFRPDPNLARRLYCQIPSGPGVTVDPRSGRLTTKDRPNPSGTRPSDCEGDRQMLAAIDDYAEFHLMLDAANRANASFYPVDPRGLAVFDTPMVPVNGPSLYKPAPLVTPAADNAMLASRLGSLRTLADATDGLAIVNNNDLAAGFRRIVDDLSSYYLLGYYSTGKLDGKFHSITVRVKRPGVQVRARRGFLAATPAAASRSTASGALTPEAAAAATEAHAVEAAVGPLESYARDVPLRVQAAAGWKPGTPPVAAVWLVGEIGGATFGDDWKQGADAEVTMATASGTTVATAHATIAPGAKAFRTMLAPSAPLAPGDYVIRVGARAAGGAAIPSRDTVHIVVPAAPDATGAIVLRRGLSTGNRDTPTADLRFRRSETIHVEVPAPAVAAVSGRLLDRTGKALPIPVTAAMRDDNEGARWETGQLALAPLAVGDYVIELTAGATRKLVAFRVIQ